MASARQRRTPARRPPGWRAAFAAPQARWRAPPGRLPARWEAPPPESDQPPLASGTAAHTAGGAAWNGGSHTYRGARRAYRGASHLGSGVYGGASRVGGSVRQRFADVLENEPLVIGALGLAVGAAIGALLPRTQAEDRYLGETSDHLREAAQDFGKEKLEQGKAVAEEVYRTAKEKAEEAGLTASGEDSLVGKVGEVARATMEKARESAGEAGLVEREKTGEAPQRDFTASG